MDDHDNIIIDVRACIITEDLLKGKKCQWIIGVVWVSINVHQDLISYYVYNYFLKKFSVS